MVGEENKKKYVIGDQKERKKNYKERGRINVKSNMYNLHFCY